MTANYSSIIAITIIGELVGWWIGEFVINWVSRCYLFFDHFEGHFGVIEEWISQGYRRFERCLCLIINMLLSYKGSDSPLAHIFYIELRRSTIA